MPVSVVILAAGQGKRMNSDLPKVLQPLAGRPLLKHVIDTARLLEPEAIYVVYGHGGSQVQDALHDDDIDWVLQAQQLGTGHALLQAMPLIPDEHTVLVLYGDVPLIKAQTLLQLAAQADGALALLTVELGDPSGYGRIVREAGRILGIVEHADASDAQRRIREINTGIMAAPADKLRHWLLKVKSSNRQQEFYLTDVAGIAAGAGTEVSSVAAGNAAEVAGVNDKIQLSQAEAHYRSARAHELMLAGATLADPARIDIRGEVRVGKDVFIDVNVVLCGKVQLGAGARVGPNSLISDSSIGPGTEVLANCVIEQATVGADCRIGPYARLRPQAELQEHVHIGNFVEVKNTRVGAHSKANHLAYLGDAQVGSHVNVGAGCITVNYDGANKWPTTIEDDAFVGSGSMLVAPVRIAAGSTIGAGSTITESCLAGELTLTRAKQTCVPGWQRPPKFTAEEKASRIAQRLQNAGEKKPKS